jgi:hypothetical protein
MRTAGKRGAHGMPGPRMPFANRPHTISQRRASGRFRRGVAAASVPGKVTPAFAIEISLPRVKFIQAKALKFQLRYYSKPGAEVFFNPCACPGCLNRTRACWMLRTSGVPGQPGRALHVNNYFMILPEFALY